MIPGKRPSAEPAVLAVLTLAGACLRVYRLDSPLWFDEILTLLNSVRQPLARIVAHFPGNNDHPLYSLLAHLTVTALGEEPWTLRLPAALAGIVAVPVLYVVGRAVTSRLEAGAAALILTVSYHHVWFSQNARAYTLLLVCVLVSTHALLRWLDTGRGSWLALYVGATAVGAYAHLTMVLVCLSQALVCAFEWISTAYPPTRSRADWTRLAGAFVCAALLTILVYAPMLANVGTFFTTRTAAPGEVATPAWAIGAALRGLEAGFGPVWILAPGAGLFMVGLGSYLRERRAAALLFFLPVPVTILLAQLLARPVFPRFAFFAIGFGLLAGVRGAAVVGGRLAAMSGRVAAPSRAAALAVAVVTLVAVALSVQSLPRNYLVPKQDYDGAVAFIDENLLQFPTRAGTALVWGAHWRSHLLSHVSLMSIGFGLAGPVLLAAGRSKGSSSGPAVFAAAAGGFLCLTVLFEPGADSFRDPVFLGHQVREFVTSALVTIPMAWGVCLLLARQAWQGRSAGGRPAGVVLTACGAGAAVAAGLVVAALPASAQSHGQSASGVVLVFPHVFEHAFSYVVTTLVAALVVEAGLRRLHSSTDT